MAKHSFYEMCDFFEYLDELRKSGSVNMFGASPYLAQEFGIGIHAAREVLRKWQDTFGDGALEDRVNRAQTAA